MKSEKRSGAGFAFIVLLAITLIVSNVVVNYNFDLFESTIMGSVFTYPFVYFFINRTAQSCGTKSVVFGIILSVIIQLIAFLGTNALTDYNISNLTIIGSLISFVITAIICLVMYNGLVKNKQSNYFKLLLIYIIVIIIDNLIFLGIINKGIPGDFGMTFLLSNGIKIIIGAVLAFFDMQINNKKDDQLLN